MSHVLNSTFDMGEMIDANSRWLGRELADRAHAALSAHEERSYPTAVQHANHRHHILDFNLEEESKALSRELSGFLSG